MNIDEVVAQYREQRPMYDRFTRKLRDLLEVLLDSNKVEYDLDDRTKKVDSFRDKIVRKSYTDPLREITDLSALRIILRRLSDIPRVTRLMKRDFAVDPWSSKDKKEDLRVDQFGYRSVHLIVGMRKKFTGRPEWEPYRKIKAEIQVRTDLQDVWAVLSHPFDYKVEAATPRELRRRLFRMGALFELADEEINNLTTSFKAKIKNYKERLDRGEVVPVDMASLRLFIETTREGKYWIRRARKITGRPIDDWGDLSKAVRVAEFFNLKTSLDIERVIEDAHGWGEKFISNYFAELEKAYDTRASSTDPTKIGIISGLIIARYADKLNDKILEGELGFPSSPILFAALKARVPS